MKRNSCLINSHLSFRFTDIIGSRGLNKSSEVRIGWIPIKLCKYQQYDKCKGEKKNPSWASVFQNSVLTTNVMSEET
jgi:hypothetical protein